MYKTAFSSPIFLNDNKLIFNHEILFACETLQGKMLIVQIFEIS